jgi:hypothetical protein
MLDEFIVVFLDLGWRLLALQAGVSKKLGSLIFLVLLNNFHLLLEVFLES